MRRTQALVRRADPFYAALLYREGGIFLLLATLVKSMLHSRGEGGWTQYIKMSAFVFLDTL